MKVNVALLPPRKSYDFAQVVLSYGSPEETSVALNIDYRNLYEFTRIQNGVSVDLFVIASIVYGVDILIPRNKLGFDAWSREIEVSFPVESPEVFNNGKEDLEKTLRFLTGDLWTVSFEHRSVKRLYKEGKRQKVYTEAFRKRHICVNLFS